jgi:hypothetical protein
MTTTAPMSRAYRLLSRHTDRRLETWRGRTGRKPAPMVRGHAALSVSMQIDIRCLGATLQPADDHFNCFWS